MNWVQYLQDNIVITDPGDLVHLRKATDVAALALSYKYGWDNYSITCSEKSLLFNYTKDGILYTAIIPLRSLLGRFTIKPVLEEIVAAHSLDKD